MGLNYDRVLVTGGMGFIGRHAVRSLQSLGSKVWVLDNLSGSQRPRNAHRLEFQFVKGDVRSKKTVRKLVRKVDAVVHLAAILDQKMSVLDPALVSEVNVSGTVNVIESARRARIHRVIFASSAAVYGDLERAYIPERSPLQPISSYGVSKLAGEQYCRVFNELFQVDVISLRFFNVYGPGQSTGPYSGVISRFIGRLKSRRPAVIYGDGAQTRDFVHVSDAVRAITSALGARRCGGESFNVGTGRSTSIMELYRLLARLTNAKVHPVYKPERPGDIKTSCADVTKAKERLGFQAAIPLELGLRELLEKS